MLREERIYQVFRKVASLYDAQPGFIFRSGDLTSPEDYCRVHVEDGFPLRRPDDFLR